MALIIIDRRTIIDEADTQTGWTGTTGTTTSDFAEGAAAVTQAYNPGSGSTYFTLGASINLSDTLIYVYSFNNALQVDWDTAEPPNALFLGDGVDEVAFHMAGGNKDVFKHSEGPTSWQCLVLDGAEASNQDAAGLTYEVAGTFANLDLTQITQVGAYHDTLSKALGGGYNAAVDILRYGNDGIYIVGGTSGDKGSFSEIAAADRSTADKAAHGLFRAYTTIAFGCQGPLTFGRPFGGNDAYFEDSGVVVVFEDRNIGDDKYYLEVRADSTANNWFGLSNSTITTAGPKVRIEFGEDLDDLTLSAVSFVDLGNTITFPTDAPHSVDGCTFTGCGQVTIGSGEFRNCTFSNTTADSTSEEAAAWLQFDYEDIESCTFSDNYYAIVMGIDSTSDEAITFTNLTFSNNVYDVLWLGTGTLTITVVGGTIPTYFAPNGGTVLLPSSVTLTMTVKDEAGAVIVGAFAYIDDDNETPFIMNTTTNGSGIATVAHTGGAVGGSTWRVRLYGYKAYVQTIDIAGDDISIPVTLIADPQQT